MEKAEKQNILIVDDRPENLMALETLLESPDLNIIKAASGNEALSAMLERDLALVLLDVQMPEMDGFETAELMRGSDRTRDIPIIFVTAISKEKRHVFKGYDAGAVDYIFKPLDPHILKSKVRVLLELQKQKMELKQTNETLQGAVDALKNANKKIMMHQKSAIQEERFKVLLELAGATAHELNQPLMYLLGNIEILGMDEIPPEKQANCLLEIKAAGERISAIVKKIQTVRHDKTLSYAGKTPIINIHQKIKILLLEDFDEDFNRIKNVLERNEQVELVRGGAVEEAMGILDENPVDIIFLDASLPGEGAIEFIKRMGKEDVETPVVVITDRENAPPSGRMLREGGRVCLSRDKVDEDSLFRVIFHALEKVRLGNVVKEARQRLNRLSFQDPLTKVYGQRFFDQALEREAKKSRQGETVVSICLVHLDQLGRINDLHGRPAGERVLFEMARVLEGAVRERDLVCRRGEESFTLIFPETRIEEARAICERIREMASIYPFQYNSSRFQITLSMGVASFGPSEEPSPARLTERAETALQQAIETGKNNMIALG
ncbi:MAG: response regulator [Desulfobacterales bacterium]|nr:response regulator [Desulfobacterales bacterium]